MRWKALLLGLGLTLGLATVVMAQTGALDVIIQKIQGLLQTKGPGEIFLNLTGPGEKVVEEGPATNTFSELEEPTPVTPTLLSSLKQALENKPATFEHGFLLPQKEPGPVGNEFAEELGG